MASAYRHYDNAAGARFRVGKVSPSVPYTRPEPPRRGRFQSRNVLGVREAAALWHPLGAGDEMPMVQRSGARALLPSARGVSAGAPRGIHRCRKKRRYTLRRPDETTPPVRGQDPHGQVNPHASHRGPQDDGEGCGQRQGCIVVIDPHADLVNGLLEHVPEEIVDSVKLIDLADESRSPGINLLDTGVFTDRDRTADSVVRVAKGLWDQWGPRMQSILEQTSRASTRPTAG